MGDSNRTDNTVLTILRVIVLLYLITSVFGRNFLDNNWSFLNAYFLPIWYDILLLIAAGLVLFVPRVIDKLFEVIGSSVRILSLTVILVLALLVIFQFNSFIHGGGNLLVAQIGQVPVIINRWFELGSSILISIFHSLFTSLSLETTKAAVYAWKTFAFTCTIYSLLGSWLLSGVLVTERIKRVALSLLIFAGPQLILMFAPVAVETIVPPFVIFWAYLALRIRNKFSFSHLILLWLVSLIAVLMFHTLAFLIPATVFVSIPKSARKLAWLGHLLAAITLVGLFWEAYNFAGNNLEYAAKLLFLKGKNPHASYALFSIRHISDFLQMIWLSFPLIIINGFLCWRLRREEIIFRALFFWLVLPGAALLFILDPVNSIVLDLPRLLAYLTPLVIVLAALSAVAIEKQLITVTTLTRLASISVLISLSFIPVHTVIANSDPYVTDYLEKHQPYYRTACFAFRDAYFYRGEMTRDFKTSKADSWEQRLKIKSPEQLQLDGIIGLTLEGQKTSAVSELFQMTLRFPYWTEPKALLAKLQIEYRQFDQAAKLIEQCRQLEPYKPDHRRLQYIYYRDRQNYPAAVATLDTLLELLPGDLEATTDKMIAFYRAREFNVADSLGEYLMQQAPGKPYPYLIRGLIQEGKNNPSGAIYYYESLVKLNAKESQEYNIPARLDSLQSIINN